jgi:hypothetical protein
LIQASPESEALLELSELLDAEVRFEFWEEPDSEGQLEAGVRLEAQEAGSKRWFEL